MAHPTTHHNCQTFRFLTRTWCISRALELIDANPTAAQFIQHAEIEGLDRYLAATSDVSHTQRLLVVEVDQQYAATADLTKPIILVRFVTDSGTDCGLLLIDGWHRVYRARREGRTHLPAYLLSPT